MSFIPPKDKNIFIKLASIQSQLDKLRLSLDSLTIQKRDLCVHIENCQANIKYLKKSAKIVNVKYFGEITAKLQSHEQDLQIIEKTVNIHLEAIKRLQVELSKLEQHIKQSANNVLEFKKNVKKP
jgi:chromosome segregation ATPase